MAYKPEQIEHWMDYSQHHSRKYLKKVTNRVNRRMLKQEMFNDDFDSIRTKYKRYTKGWEL
jgi:hypothetical protein